MPRRVASELLEHTPTYFGGELDILVEKPIFWWRTRYFGEESGVYFGGELSYFAEHGLVRTSEEYKISPWKSVSAKNFTIASNSFLSLVICRIRVIFKTK